MSKRSLLLVLFVAFVFANLSLAQEPSRIHQPKLTPQDSGTTQGLIAVSPVNPRVVWASGRGGTFVVTSDGGKHWKAGVVPGADDGGANWTMQFQNQNPGAFYDCFAFWTPKRGISHSDSVNGVFPDLRTTDGTTWQDISSNMPPALPGEFSFASSGTCVATQGARNAWITTGGATTARILATRDGGNTWNAYDTPLLSSPSAGGFTVAFRDPWHGIVGGGDLDPNDPNNAATATSDDGGQTWTLTNAPPVTGAIFGLSYVGRAGGHEQHSHDDGGRAVVITANDGGAAWTPDEGNTWFTLADVSGFWAVAFASPEAGWLVGTDGRILKISFGH